MTRKVWATSEAKRRCKEVVLRDCQACYLSATGASTVGIMGGMGRCAGQKEYQRLRSGRNNYGGCTGLATRTDVT